jgi:hypothetical protein
MKSLRIISEEMGKALAENLKIPYMETCALNRKDVEEVFNYIAFFYLNLKPKVQRSIE